MPLSAQTNIVLARKISHLDRLLFTKHLTTMIKAGIPLPEALETLRDQTKSARLQIVLSKVLASVENGKGLAESLKDFNKDFDQFYVSLVEIGETAGTLEESLDFLAEQLKKDYALRKKIQGALMYPALVFIAMGVMGTFISLAVLPKLVSFFDAFEIDLPFTTKVLLAVANFMASYGVVFFVSLFIGIFLLWLLMQSKTVKPWWHKQILKMPLFGELIKHSQLSRFARNLGTLLKSGVPIVQALDTTAETLSNLSFKKSVAGLSSTLSKGKSIGKGMEQLDNHDFPPLVSKMVSVGEKTGKLEDTLLYLAEYYEDEIEDSSKNLTTILEPVLLLVIGLIVGFVALAIISPIYELSGSIRR
jgi:type II secretory pathway component PulF